MGQISVVLIHGFCSVLSSLPSLLSSFLGAKTAPPLFVREMPWQSLTLQEETI